MNKRQHGKEEEGFGGGKSSLLFKVAGVGGGLLLREAGKSF